MASVQELIALANHEANTRNPGARALSNVLAGFQQSQNNDLERVKNLIAIDEHRKAMERAQEEDRQARAMLEQQQENSLKAGMNAAAGPGKPVTSRQKIKTTFSTDSSGRMSRGYEIIDTDEEGKASSFQQVDYVDEKGVQRIGRFNTKTGDIIRNPNDPIAKPTKPVQTKGQEAVDRNFAKEYSDYVASGGFADTMTQITGMSGVLSDLKSGRKNLTGPGVGALPDAVRKRTLPASYAAQQTVEQSVQRTLKKTLGGQFTEKEGILFMQRGYDPALPEAENAKKLERAIGTLKMMAVAKQRAVDYWEENGTLDGFKGEFFRLQDGEPVRATKADFYAQMDQKMGLVEPEKKTAESRFSELLDSGKSEDEAYRTLAQEGY